jgi:tetratricopeptide (TPR) repeat protein
MRRIATSAALLLGILAAAASHAQEDQIFGKSGTPTRGTITAVSPSEIKIQSRGAPLTFAIKDVLKVTFDGEPPELRTARERALAGQYEDAVEELKKIDVGAIRNSVISQDVGYYAAYCTAKLALTAGGDKDAAIDLLKGFIGQNRTTFHFFEGVELLGELNFAAGKYTDAATFYGLLSQAPWPEYKMKASVLQARAKSAEGKDAEALPLFEQVLSSGLNTPEAVEQKMHATVGKAVCLSATGKADEGIAMIEDLIAKNDPTDMTLFGRAYNALGACYQKAGETQDALLAYLHTDVLFFGDREAHAEALYHLSKLWAETNRSDRATRARSLLQSRYAGSRWAAMP